MTTLSSAVSPNRNLVVIHSQPKDGNTNNINRRVLIKCYDSNVSMGTLKFTLSANLKDDNIDCYIENLHFASNDCLLAILSNGKVLVFDLKRGVHSQTVDVKGNSNGDVCACIGNGDLIYSLIKKDGKSIVFVYDIQKGGKMVKKIKGSSCDDDDRLGLAVHNNDLIAICTGKKIKVTNCKTGESISKCKVKSNDEGKASHGEKNCMLQFSADGMILLASTPNGVHLFAVKSGDRIGTIRTSDISSIQVLLSQDKYIAAVVSGKSKVSLSEINVNKKSNIDSFATMTLPTSTTENTTIINEAFFLAGKQGSSDIVLLELTPRGISNADVVMNQVSYRNKSNQLQTGELYPESSDEGQKDKQSASKETSKKRKSPPGNIVLGPGESGGEAMTVTDQTAVKRLKTNIDNESDDDDDDFALEDGDEAEETISQRLALLSSELDRDTEDEEDLLKIQKGASNKFLIKTATSESLSILLRQSLMANDDAQLEVALQVSDKRVIENSILGLANESSGDNDDDTDGEIIIMLLTKLVTRLSRKPSRAQRLAFWIRTVLVALISKIGSSSVEMGKAEKEIASRLGPLRNLLSERVESLPELLRLEGRLSLLNSQL